MRGTSLVESLVALAVLGVVGGIAVPKSVSLRDRMLVERHTRAVMNGYQRARLAALLGASRVVLITTPDEFAVWVLRGADSSLAWRAPGPAGDGVTFSGPARTSFTPAGVTMGLANGRFGLLRGGISRTVVASRLGRLRVTAPRHRGRRRHPPSRRCPDSS
jgi:type II secretory pathway pseudopilin PulG